MTEQEAIDYIKEIYRTHSNKISAGSIVARNKELNEFLRNKYPHLINLSEMRFWLLNGLTERPKCPVCGNIITKFEGNHYPKTCCKACGMKNPERQENYKNTCKEKYGETSTSKVKSIKDSIWVNRKHGIRKPKYTKVEVSTVQEIIDLYNSWIKDNVPHSTISQRIGKIDSLYKVLKEKYSHLELPSEMMYWLLNNLTDYPKCKYCGNPVHHFLSLKDGYHSFCCHECSTKEPIYNPLTNQYNIEKAKETILEIVYHNENENSVSAILRRNYDLNAFLSHIYPNIQSNIERCYWLVHDIKEIPLCPVCNKPVNFDTFQNGYFTHCCKRCAEHSSYNLRNIGLKYYFNNIIFDSSFELLYYIYLKENNIQFEFQPSIYFEYTDAKLKVHRYYPDFRLSDGSLIEIKGNLFFDESGKLINPYNRKEDYIGEAKMQCMVDHNVRILRETDLISLGIKLHQTDSKVLRKFCNFLRDNDYKDFFCNVQGINKRNYITFIDKVKDFYHGTRRT